MSGYDNGPRVDPYEIVERYWPYDGPYSDELTVAAAVMIGRLGRYLNNATQKRDGLPYVATVGRIVSELHGAVAGYEQLLVQFARFVEREADTNSSVYDDRHDRHGATTAHELAADLRDDVLPALRSVADALDVAARGAYHLGSD